MHDVVIVGGGPVGLFTAVLLCQAGLDVQVLEQRTERSGHSRAIGIHPPALRALAEAGVAQELIEQGIRIPGGIARRAGRPVATLSFAGLPSPYPFVLALPQVQTERVLESRLMDLAPGSLQRGVSVTDVHDVGASVQVATSTTVLQARLIIGADGARSAVRTAAGIGTTLRTYPDTYLMGDFTDTTDDGATAALYLEPGGIVESFPLPGGIRRWVVRTTSLADAPTADGLAALISERTGVAVDSASSTMLSSFGVRRRIAERFVRGRVLLVGDAAHEVSPIGGQGMNLGWLDAAELAPLIHASLVSGDNVGAAVRAYAARRRHAAFTASRQAHLNMVLGRPLPPAVLALRNNALSALTRIPAVSSGIARTFTMH